MDQWVEENWERLKRGGVDHFIPYREWVRKNPRQIELQEERWAAEGRANERATIRAGRQLPEPPLAPVWDGPPPAPQAEQLWKTVLDSLQSRLPRPTFETWLRPTTGMAIDTGETDALVVVAPSPFAVEWLERRMFHALHGELQKAAGRPIELQLRVAGPVYGPSQLKEMNRILAMENSTMTQGSSWDLNKVGFRVGYARGGDHPNVSATLPRTLWVRVGGAVMTAIDKLKSHRAGSQATADAVRRKKSFLLRHRGVRYFVQRGALQPQ